MNYVSEPFSISLGGMGDASGTQVFCEPSMEESSVWPLCWEPGVSLWQGGELKDPQERPLRSELERIQPTLKQPSGETED